MGGGLILLIIVVVISVTISVASNWLRGQQRQLEEKAAERRARSRTTAGGGAGVKTGAGDIDRFLEEINKLRQKPPAGAEPTSRPPRRAEPVRAAPVRPAAPPPTLARRVDPPAPRLEDLPVAPMVARPVPPPPPPQGAARPLQGATKPIIMQPGKPAGPQTPFARQLMGLLTHRGSAPMAVVLTEILGPPKCKRRPGERGA